LKPERKLDISAKLNLLSLKPGGIEARIQTSDWLVFGGGMVGPPDAPRGVINSDIRIKGDISQPARVTLGTTYGWHLVWLRDRVPAHSMTIEQDYERVKQVALYVKRNKKNAEWVEELKKTIYLDIRL